MDHHCNSVLTLMSYLRQKAESHNHYKAYSSLKRTLAIQKDQALYLGRTDKWNDITDRNSFKTKDNLVRFCKCFSFLKEESIAMWMLYGGIDKRSGMIDFTKKGMQSILKTKNVILGFFSGDVFQPVTTLSEGDFEIFITDVVYYRENANSYYIKRGEEMIPNLPKEIFEHLHFCKKVYPWQYENECRLIVSLKSDRIPEECNQLKIDLSKMDLGISLQRIYKGPNYPTNDFENILPSKMKGTVDWKLCDFEKCPNHY